MAKLTRRLANVTSENVAKAYEDDITNVQISLKTKKLNKG